MYNCDSPCADPNKCYWQEGCGFLTPRSKRECGASYKDKHEKVLAMKASQFACEIDSSLELKNLMEQEFFGEHNDVFEEVLIAPVAEHESLVDGDEDPLLDEVLSKPFEEHEPPVDGGEDLLLENVLVESVEEREPLLDGDEDRLLEDKSLPDIGEHVLVDQRSGPSTSQRGTYSINRATMVGSSIQPDSNASDKKKRPLYFTARQGENESVLA